MSVVINVVGQFDGKQLDRAQRELDKLGKSVKGQESKVQSMGRSFKMAGGLVAAAVGGQMVGSAVRFGMRMEELSREAETTERKFDTVFGDMADTMRRWADEQNEAFGVSETVMQGFAANVQDILIPLGFARDEAAGMTKEILTLANALAEFTPGATTEQAVGALTSALTGEREQLKQFGVVLKDADIKARLAEKGLDGLTGEALKQESAIASLELAYGLAGDALDAYGNRAGTAEAETKALAAAAADAEQDLANLFGPEVQFVKEQLGELATDAARLASELADMRDAEDASGSLLDELSRFSLINEILKAFGQEGVPALDAFGATADSVMGGGGKVSRALGMSEDAINAWSARYSGAAEQYADDSEDVADATEEMSTAVADATEEMAEAAAENLEDLRDDVGGVVDVFDGAADELEVTFDEMVANLRESASQQQRFVDGLEILYSRGLDDVADAFRERGPEAVGALEDFLAKPIADQLRFEDEFEQAERDIADGVADMANAARSNAATADRWEALGEYWAQMAEEGFNNYPWYLMVPTPQPATPSNPSGSPIVREGFPVLHDGGVFSAPRGQREGFALLEDGETVLPAGKKPMGGVNITINNPQSNDLNADISKAMTAVRLLGVV